MQNLARRRLLEIQRDAFDATVVGFEKRARHSRKNRSDTRPVASIGSLDLDDISAKVSHQHIGDGSSLRCRAADDLHTLQGTMRLTHGLFSQSVLLFAFERSLLPQARLLVAAVTFWNSISTK
jgi:hypothetical protein